MTEVNIGKTERMPRRSPARSPDPQPRHAERLNEKRPIRGTEWTRWVLRWRIGTSVARACRLGARDG
jgi:hypothetical protein